MKCHASKNYPNFPCLGVHSPCICTVKFSIQTTLLIASVFSHSFSFSYNKGLLSIAKAACSFTTQRHENEMLYKGRHACSHVYATWPELLQNSKAGSQALAVPTELKPSFSSPADAEEESSIATPPCSPAYAATNRRFKQPTGQPHITT